MRFKNVGMIPIGAAAAMVAAPIAMATDGHAKDDHHGHHGGGKACAFNGGEASSLWRSAATRRST